MFCEVSAELILTPFFFFSLYVPSENDNVNNAYDEFEERQKNNEIISFAAEEGIEKDSVEEKLAEYEFSGSMKREELVKIFKGEGLKERVRRADLLEKFIKEIVEKYSK